jgi:hypothetical protein
VEDFNGGPNGWVIVTYAPSRQVVRGGMLGGWLDNGGAPGSLGCPTNDEHPYMSGVRQDFQHGSLYWASGMKHAARMDSGRQGVPTTINGVNVGYPQNGPHWWGSCVVQDFNGGPNGWVIVSYNHGTDIVRGGMLGGWLDNGGAPGALGCPTTQENGYTNGVKQDFVGGHLFWMSGMNHATRFDPDSRIEKAVAWAWHCIPDGTCSYEGTVRNYYWYCLGFVTDAYAKTGPRLTGGPYGENSRAYQWWYSRPQSEQHPHDTNAPRGALVIWDQKFAPDGSGHIALSLGGGWAISTYIGGSDKTIHVIRIADYAGPTYLGWVYPK